MTPVNATTYFADAHRHDLLCEARQAALAAEVASATGGMWSAALLTLADLLVHAGQRLHVRLSHKRLVHAHVASFGIESMCHHDGALCKRIVWQDA